MKRRTLSAMAFLAILTVLVFPLQGQTERRPFRMMARDILDLTPEQQTGFDEMAQARESERKDFFDRMKKINGELEAVLKDPGLDPKKADGLIDEMARLRAEHLKSGLRHRYDMRKILTPDQIKKLDEYREAFRAGRRAGRMRPLGRRFGRFGGGFPGRGFRFRSRSRWW